jgi:hypothetical protein
MWVARTGALASGCDQALDFFGGEIFAGAALGGGAAAVLSHFQLSVVSSPSPVEPWFSL